MPPKKAMGRLSFDTAWNWTQILFDAGEPFFLCLVRGIRRVACTLGLFGD